MQAVIISGGLGTRLKPLTDTVPKGLVEVQGRPLLEHVLDLLKEAGVDDVILSVGYLGDRIKEHFRDGEGHGVRIRYVEEDKPLGTGGWLHKAKEMLSGDFFVVNGDNLFALDLHEMLRSHQEKGATATIGLTKVEDPSSFGIAAMDGDRIARFVEKPSKEEAPSDLANGGYYVFNERIFDMIPSRERFMLEQDVFPALAEEGRLYGFPSDAQWFDTGTFERLEEVESFWRKGSNA